MPKIACLKEIDGAIWAKLELNIVTDQGSVYVLTDEEIKKIKNKERQAVLYEIQEAINKGNEI